LCERVKCFCFVVFVVVTALTGKGEVVHPVITAFGLGDDVFYGKWLRGDSRRREAILA
jgi:hypothetical protein